MKVFLSLIFLFAITIPLSLLQQPEPIPYRNIMYYGESSIYSGQHNFYPSKINAKLITHLIFTFLDMDSNGDLVLNDEYADFQTVNLPELEEINFSEPYAGILGAMSILKVQNSHLKLGISVGGPSSSEKFYEISRENVKRQNFAVNIVKFIKYVGFDFIDINLGTETVEESDNFILLLKAIRSELDSIQIDGKIFELSVSMSPYLEQLGKMQFDKVLHFVNFTNLLTYDFNGGWNSYTGHQTPLYVNKAYEDTDIKAQFSIDSCITYLEETYGSNIDMKKIVIGVAPYTRAWAGVQDDGLDKNNPGLYATAAPDSVRGADGTKSGIFGYHELPSLMKEFGLVEFYDKKAGAAYYYSPTTGYFFSCDNEESVAEKGRYVKKKGLGGMFIWMASYDAENTITKAMFNSLYEEGYTFPEQELKYNLISISCTIKATETGYDITIQNNGVPRETNPALKYGELFMTNILNMKVYIVSKSGAEFSAGANSGSVINENGQAILDPSSNKGARIVHPNFGHYSFSVNVNGTPDVKDIKGIHVSQRILPSLKEFKKRIIWGSDV